MAEAFSGADRTSYKYQFSALPGLHGQDVAGYFGPLGSVPYLSTDYQRAFMSKPSASKAKVFTDIFQKYGATTSPLQIRLSQMHLRPVHRAIRRLHRMRPRAGQYSLTRRPIN
jgi:hypothetical protein